MNKSLNLRHASSHNMLHQHRFPKSFIANNQHFVLSLAYICLAVAAFLTPLSITGTNISMTEAAILCILSGLFFDQFKVVRSNPIILISLLIIALVFIGMFWSIGPWKDRLSSLHKYAKLLYIPFLIPLCLNVKWRKTAVDMFLIA